MIRDKLSKSIEHALLAAKEDGELCFDALPDISLETPKNSSFGDFSSNIAMTLAREVRKSPRDTAVI
ncbi:MAG: arginine--tRNA ligase, partial [Armatimonadota bacterium]